MTKYWYVKLILFQNRDRFFLLISKLKIDLNWWWQKDQSQLSIFIATPKQLRPISFNKIRSTIKTWVIKPNNFRGRCNRITLYIYLIKQSYKFFWPQKYQNCNNLSLGRIEWYLKLFKNEFNKVKESKEFIGHFLEPK